MSWQLGAFSILALGLVAGFGWYERTRPDARTIALVGALAALGALGRIAFAALPNVKPTTDIVLVSGYALGGAPGYVVGALAALTSNFFFGQGPWTPWQMAGWGAVGILGALLARLTRGRIGRWPLACICFPIGFAFTALQDVGDWVTYSDHSVGQLWVYVGKGAGFDLIHACGCFAFALVFGPALISALRRFRRRLNVTWLTAGGPLAAGLLAALALTAPTARPTAAAAAVERHHATPVEYLLSAENRDGGVGMAPGQASSAMVSAWAAMALGAAGVNPSEPARPGGLGLVGYLATTLAQDTDPGGVERAILAVRAAHEPATDFAGVNLVARLRHDIGAGGSVEDQCNLTAFAILALRAARSAPPVKTVAWLARQQDRDGGFNYATGGAVSDVDDTGAVLEALAGSGHAREIRRAVAFIRSQQSRDGGFPAYTGGPSNAQSTAFAVQGLIAAHVKLADVRKHRSPDPIQYLRSLIQPSGAVDYAAHNRQSPVWVTAEAELALVGKVL